MNLIEFIKGEFVGWGKYERLIFPLEIAFIICVSFYIGDNKIALISAVCGISYTILAGKGKISCYFLGLCGTLCYAYLAYKNGLWGNLLLYMCYYFPMQIFGIFQWKKFINNESKSIVKTFLPDKTRYLFFVLAISISSVFSVVLYRIGDMSPVIDGFTTVFSVFGLILTVKRCIEQWYFWTIVNGLSVIMWLEAYFKGSNCLATVLMWATYFVLGIYFLYTWKKDLSGSNQNKVL